MSYTPDAQEFKSLEVLRHSIAETIRVAAERLAHPQDWSADHRQKLRVVLDALTAALSAIEDL